MRYFNLGIVNLILSFFLIFYCLATSYLHTSLEFNLIILVYIESYIALSLEKLVNLALFFKLVRFSLFLLLILLTLIIFRLR